MTNKHLSTASIFLLTVVALSSCKNYTIKESSFNTKTKEISQARVDSVLAQDENQTEVCTTKRMEWAPGNNESIILDPTGQLFVGEVLSAESIQDGSYVAIGDANIRCPIKISTEQQNLAVRSVVVKKPTLSTVRDAVDSIVNSKQTGTGDPRLTVTAEEITSKDYLDIYLQGKYSGGATNLEASFQSINDDSKRHFLIDITQVYYTLTTDDIGPDGFFTSKPSNIDNTFPVYIRSMTFGRRIWIIYETSASSKITKADLQAQFSFFSGTASTDNHVLAKEDLQNSSLKVLMVGGNLNSIRYTPTSIADLATLQQLITSGLKFSDSVRGTPLSYALTQCWDKKIYRMVNAGKYTIRDCQIKTGHDTTIFAKSLPPLEHICAEWTHKGDRNFNGDCDILFNMGLTWEKNIVYYSVFTEWNEIHGDGTQGQVNISRKELLRLPANYTIISIDRRGDDIGAGRHADKNAVTDLKPVHPDSSPFSRVLVVGDGPTDDDMPGGCADDQEHAQIRTISWNDIKITYTVDVLRKGK